MGGNELEEQHAWHIIWVLLVVPLFLMGFKDVGP